MSKHKICLIVGARPNFMKSAPLMRELLANDDSFDTKLIHTGQHYDHALSQLFFDELKMPKPDLYLGVGSGSHAEQTGKIMIELEKSFGELKPDLVVVFGDINSTLAAAIVTAKMCIKLAHVEAGLRSFDNTMPEEINRIVTDRLSHYLYVSEDSGLVNLRNEGVTDEKVFYTGNIMIDSLVANLEIAKKSDILDKLHLEPNSYIAMTMHRPANVDEEDKLRELFENIIEVSEKMPIVFPCHPRTKKRLEDFGITSNAQGLKMIEPLGYLDFLKLQSNANFVLTDSGGVQEETTYLKIPCITMRENTERPSTVDIGSNIIVGVNPKNIRDAAMRTIQGERKQGNIPRLWDGKTAGRIVQLMKEHL